MNVRWEWSLRCRGGPIPLSGISLILSVDGRVESQVLASAVPLLGADFESEASDVTLLFGAAGCETRWTIATSRRAPCSPATPNAPVPMLSARNYAPPLRGPS